MSEPEAYRERIGFDLHASFVMDGGDMSEAIAGAHFPIHFGGMAATLNNGDQNVNAVITVDDSDDGTTWTPVLFSSDTQSSLLALTVVPLGQQQILFESGRRYVRFTTTPRNPGGVNVVTHQFVPRSRISEEAYS